MLELTVIILLFAVGLGLTVKGGDIFVDAAGGIARATGIPPFVIGATVVSLATSAPELLVSLMAAVRGADGLAAGNAVGSVAANMGLVFGLTLAIAPGAAAADFRKKALLMLGATALMLVSALDGRLSVAESLLALGLLGLYVWLAVRDGRGGARPSSERGRVDARAITGFLLGAGAIAVGARLLVVYGSELAVRAGLSEGVVGLSLVAVGTSLPELVTAISAMAKGEVGISAGNILGANVVDMALILPACALVRGGGMSMEAATAVRDLPVCLLLMLTASLPALFGRRFTRLQGFLLLALYAGYMALVFIQGG